MRDIDLTVLSELVSLKTGTTVAFTTIERIGGGFHSNGYRLTDANGKMYFLKDVKTKNLGFEYPERQVMSLMVSNGMGERAGGNNPAPIGVLVLNEDQGTILPSITHDTRVFHIQEYGGTGKSYSKILDENKNKTTVDEEDVVLLSEIADALLAIHGVTHPSGNREELDSIYNDGIRSILLQPELSIMVLAEFPSDYAILDLEGQKEIISLMYENVKSWQNRGDRLTALHGDFWGANIFFREDGSIFIIDFSRIPWGDPAIDVGWFTSEMIWQYHATGNRYYRELADTWLRIYQEKSGDAELHKAVTLAIGWVGIVQIYPKFFPDIDVDLGRRFIEHILFILRKGEFGWMDEN